MVSKMGRSVTRRRVGISLIEVITAIAILAVGIWAVVTLFPRGQDIIRRSGLRQMATQLAHEAISDFLAEPAKLPYAIVPFDPTDPQIANRPVLLEPADLLTVRRTFNFVWGEPLDDGLPPGNPNKRVGLVWLDRNGDRKPSPGVDEWRAILRFFPAQSFVTQMRVYREVSYQFWGQDRNGDGQVNSSDLQDFEFYFDPTQTRTLYLAAVPRSRVLRITYARDPNQPLASLVPTIWRELYLVDSGVGQVVLRENATAIAEVVEEYPITPTTVNPSGVLIFSDPMPAPSGVPLDRLGYLRADYLIDDPGNGGGHWVVETGTTFDPDPTLRRQGVSSVFQTTLGGLNSQPVVLSLLPPPQSPLWGDPVDSQSGLLNVDFQSGLLSFSLPVGTPLRVAYRAGDIPNTPVDESWFVQVIKPPDDFQLFTSADPQVLAYFPYERLRWFTLNGGKTVFNPLLAGLSVQVRYREANTNEMFTEAHSIAGDGSVTLMQLPARIEEVRGASLLVRVSGGSMWRQSPPKTRADYVELATLIPPPAKQAAQP